VNHASEETDFVDFLQHDVLGDNMVVVYNRVPKTGSTSFVGIAYDLCAKNMFHVLHVNVSKNNHVLSLADQVLFMSNDNCSAVTFYICHCHWNPQRRVSVIRRVNLCNSQHQAMSRLLQV
jgi:Sulfotransferase family